MGTDDNGYELAVCRQLGKAAKLCTGTRFSAHCIAYGIPDVLGTARGRYAGKTVMVVGSGHSALNALIELEALRRDFPSMNLIWIIRKAHVEAAFGGEDADARSTRH